MKRQLCKYVVTPVVAAMLSLSAVAQEMDEVSVAIGQRGLWDTLVVHQGIEEGIFAEENLSVDMTWTKGGAETLQAVTTRSVDMGFVNGMLGVLGAYQRGAPVRIVGAEMTGSNDLFWYVKGDSDLESLADAEGATVGYSRPGASTHLVLLNLLAEAGVDAEIVSAGGISDNRTQVMSGQLDVGWSVPPFNLDLVAAGDLKIIAKGSDIPELAEQTVRANISNTTFLTERRDVAKRFMRAYMNTVDWMYDNKDEAIERFAEFNDIELEIAKEAAEFYPKEALLSVPVKGLDKTIQEAMEHDALREPLSEEQIDELLDYVYDPAEHRSKPFLAFIWGPTTAALLVLLLLGLALEGLLASGLADRSIVAAPSEMLQSLGRLFARDELGISFLITLAQALSATIMAMLIGLPFGYALFRYELLGRAYRGWLAALFAAPLVLLYPLFLVVIGRNYGTTITMGVMTGMIPIALYTCEALHKVSPTLLKVGAAFNLTAKQRFRLIQIPAAVPDTFTGIRLGLIYALVNIIGIEFLIDFGGLGRVVSTMFFRYDIPGMYAAIFFIILISLLFLTILKRVERWLRPV